MPLNVTLNCRCRSPAYLQGGDSAPEGKKEAAKPSQPASPAPSALTRTFSVLLPVILLLIAIALNLYGGKK